MQTVGLTWQHAGETAAVLAVLGSGLALARKPVVRAAGALLREAATIGVLYALWQLAGTISLRDDGGAFRRAQWIERFDRSLPLPTERSVQHAVLGHGWLVQGLNLYYAAMHIGVMLAFLLWLFLRHREHYRRVRRVMAWSTLACLVVELVPVAPPRMLAGYVDTGQLYNQSVYDNGLPIDQLSAMPSLHVGWAVFVGYYTWRISRSRWRWIGPVHAALVTIAVVATANHWWLDGIVAVSLIAVCAWVLIGVEWAWRRLRVRGSLREPALAPVMVPDTVAS